MYAQTVFGSKKPVKSDFFLFFLTCDSLDRIFWGTKSGHVQLEPILMTIFWGHGHT